ncbi:transposase [Escherichia coli]|nr:transposase [Escherichia coli]CAD5785691.1 transposase [Escherichia coli]
MQQQSRLFHILGVRKKNKAMKNRKAKMLISRVCRLCYPSQWLRVSNRRVVLFSFVTNGAIVIHTQRLKSDPGGNLLS